MGRRTESQLLIANTQLLIANSSTTTATTANAMPIHIHGLSRWLSINSTNDGSWPQFGQTARGPVLNADE
jgi:hypothetical protein